jgi:hypothetical protein
MTSSEKTISLNFNEQEHLLLYYALDLARVAIIHQAFKSDIDKINLDEAKDIILDVISIRDKLVEEIGGHAPNAKEDTVKILDIAFGKVRDTLNTY